MGLTRVILRKPKKEKKDPNLKQDLYCDGLRDELASINVKGWAVCGKPLEMEKTIDYTTLRGGGSSIYHTLVFTVPKWDYTMKKANEWMEVTPEFEYYKLTIDEKQRLQVSIREGLMRAAEAVKDYELLAHDAERYREMLDYFIMAKTDEHVLKSLFVDRVDAFTGEGFSLVTMARRWPTIISDFIKMKTEWVDPVKVPPEEQLNKIRRELDVSVSEAAVLKTKTELYKEWKMLFLPTLKERYARIENLARSRKKSVEDYRNWLKPYVARYKMMKERLEDKPTEFLHDAYITPAAGMAQARTFVELWLWKGARPQELGKPEYRPHEKKKHGFMIDPYDDFVKARKAKIEEKYGVEITDDDVVKLMKELKKDSTYYWFQHITVEFNLVKSPSPKGTELDNPVFVVKPWTISQNVLLLHLIELKAREKKFEKEIGDLIGVGELEKGISKEVEEEFEGKKAPKKKGLRESWSPRWNTTRIWLTENVWPYFVRRGPYTPVFRERLTKHFALSISYYFVQITDFIEKNIGVG
ncbi:MAG: hypothetical protein ABIH90_02720 [Candidatus Aenigmatarchaeota archaeon]